MARTTHYKVNINAGPKVLASTYASVIDVPPSKSLPVGGCVQGMPADVRIVGYTVEIGALGQKHQLVDRFEGILSGGFSRHAGSKY